MEVRQQIFYLMLMQNLNMLFGWREETEEGKDWDKEERRKINPVILKIIQVNFMQEGDIFHEVGQKEKTFQL